MSEITNVRVALRCRPLSAKELGEGDTSCFSKDGCKAKLVDEAAHGDSENEFAFDYVYDEASCQEEVFTDVGMPVIDAAFGGFNSTVFTYGQTGSGKSWSMTGLMGDPDLKGLIPRINEELFQRITKEQTASAGSRMFLVQCSYFEIYNEIIFDLLDPTPRREKEKAGGLQIKEHPVLGIHVKGLQQIVAPDAPKIADLMRIGSSNRTTGSTAMNAESSRSHSVCQLTVHQKDAEDESKNVYSKLNLVDLAGSERADRTGATGARLKEGANINKSLSTLGSVINGLVEKAKGKKGVFIPYRDSKLTRVLQESLGGNSLCTMLATLSPAKANVKETLSTLRYAARAKTIKITATKNEESGQISQLNDEITRLRKMLAEKAAAALENPQQEEKEVDEEALTEAQAKVAAQLAEIEALKSTTWQDKLAASEKHEVEVAKMRKAHKEAARRAEVERRKRFELLRQKADVELSVKELSLPLEWAEKARTLKNLDARLVDRRKHIGVFCDALAADLNKLSSSRNEIEDHTGHHIVLRGLAEAVESRLASLNGEMAKMCREEESLNEGAESLVSLVKEAATGKDKKISMVLGQCIEFRASLRRAADDAWANLISRLEDSEKSQRPKNAPSNVMKEDLATMAMQLAAALSAAEEETTDCSKQLCVAADKARKAARTVQQMSTAERNIIRKHAMEATSPSNSSDCLLASSATSGDVKLAMLSSNNSGWRPEAGDAEGWLTFESKTPVCISSILIQPGRVADTSKPDFSSRLAPADAARTVELLGEVISWPALRLKPEKAQKLLGRPPVRFLRDVLAAVDSAAGEFLGVSMASTKEESTDPAEMRDQRKSFFETVLSALAKKDVVSSVLKNETTLTIAGFEATAEQIVAGAGVEGTNGLLQLLSLVAIAHLRKPEVTRPTQVALEYFDKAWIAAAKIAVQPEKTSVTTKASTKWRLRVEGWGKEPPEGRGALKAVLEFAEEEAVVEESDSGYSEKDAFAASAALQALTRDLEAQMRDAAAALSGATRRAAQRETEAQRALNAAEKGRAEELQAEVELLREAAGRAESMVAMAQQKCEEFGAQQRMSTMRTTELEDRCEEAERERRAAEAQREAATATSKRLTMEREDLEGKLEATEKESGELRGLLEKEARVVEEVSSAKERAEAELRETKERMVTNEAARVERLEAEQHATKSLLLKETGTEELRAAESRNLQAELAESRNARKVAEEEVLLRSAGQATAEAAAQVAVREAATAKQEASAAEAQGRREREAVELKMSRELAAQTESLEATLEELRLAKKSAEAESKKLAELRTRHRESVETSEEASKKEEEAQGHAASSLKRAEEADKQVARFKAEMTQAAEEESEKRAIGDREKLELQNQALSLQGDAQALEAQLTRLDADLKLKADQLATAGRGVADTILERDEALSLCDEAQSALNVVLEERDAARDKEEALTRHLEGLVEERDIGSEAYVRLTDQLAETRDELADTQDRLEQHRAIITGSHKTSFSSNSDDDTVSKIHATLKAHLLALPGLDLTKINLDADASLQNLTDLVTFTIALQQHSPVKELSGAETALAALREKKKNQPAPSREAPLRPPPPGGRRPSAEATPKKEEAPSPTKTAGEYDYDDDFE